MQVVAYLMMKVQICYIWILDKVTEQYCAWIFDVHEYVNNIWTCEQ